MSGTFCDCWEASQVEWWRSGCKSTQGSEWSDSLYLPLHRKGIKCTIYKDSIPLAIESRHAWLWISIRQHPSTWTAPELTSPQARFEMPMNWGRAEGGGPAIVVSAEKAERPRAHGDVTIALGGGDRGGRDHGDVGLVLAVLNSYRV